MPDQTVDQKQEVMELRHECHRLIALGKYGELELACGKCGDKIYLDAPALRALAYLLESKHPMKLVL